VQLGRVVVAVAAWVGAADVALGDRSGEAEPERRELFEDLLEALLVLGRDWLLLVVGVGLGVGVGHRDRGRPRTTVLIP
jgi:hypothetical protein